MIEKYLKFIKGFNYLIFNYKFLNYLLLLLKNRKFLNLNI